MDQNNEDGESEAKKMRLSPTDVERVKPAAISTHFASNNIHPVLVFGNVGSGKTTVLASLLNFSTEIAPQIAAFLGADAFPPDYPNASDRVDEAVRFYNDGLTDFRNFILPKKTRADLPFFIPIDAIFTHRFFGERTCRLAFLEGKGEWYERDQNKNHKYQSFRDEVVDILTYYPASISVIFVLPSDAEGYDALCQTSHDCLANCIEEYRRHRPRNRRKADNLLLLVSKWDETHPPADPSGQFASPSAAEVVRNVAYRRVWELFNGVEGLAIGAKALMPYCAAEVLGGQIQKPTAETKPILDKYNKMLWNWLFMNLTGLPSGGRESVQVAFFSDVVPAQPHFSYDSLLRLMLGSDKLAPGRA